MKILNIAGGKQRPLFLPDEPEVNKIVNTCEVAIDTGYFSDRTATQLESEVIAWENNNDENSHIYHCNINVLRFMERTCLLFDRVCIYRFLEHVSFTEVLYFIYLVSTVTKPGAYVDIIVPNYETLAQRILDEESIMEDAAYSHFENWNIKLTTELVNEPSCPHASIWTPYRAKLFWELEKRFVIYDIHEKYEFDGRDIYLRFIAKRI